MPELPEVETVRRQLAPHLGGQTIESITVLDPRWSEPAHPEAVADAVDGRVIERVSRRGKYLILELHEKPGSGAHRIADPAALPPEVYLVMHLRMTGQLLLVSEDEDVADRRHLRVRMLLDDSRRVLFCDQRRFGTGIVLLGHDALLDYFGARLGVEPLGPDFTAEALRALAAGRAAPVKAFLLNQERIAGVGNIYADEALWAARINPLREVRTLRRPQLAALRDAVVAALQAGIDSRGATIDDFRHADGAWGSFQDRFAVHRREGEPCPRCGTTIRKIRAAGRGTYFCPTCQPVPRQRRPR